MSTKPLIYSGVVPQQPPSMETPIFTNSFMSFAKSSALRSYSPVLGSGRPALGLTIKGSDDTSRILFTNGSSSLGPSEQFTPIASTPRLSSVMAMDSTSVPVKVLPFGSKVIVTQTGSFVFSLAASTPAFTSKRSVCVSSTRISAPASSPAVIISLYIS